MKKEAENSQTPSSFQEQQLAYLQKLFKVIKLNHIKNIRNDNYRRLVIFGS